MTEPALPAADSAAGTERLFVALPLPPAIREHLATLAQPLPGVTWTRPSQLHLTLRFLGDVPVSQLPAITRHLAGVRVASFLLPLEGLGTFPPNRPPRMAWIGVGSGHPRLYQLRQRIDDALLASGLALDVRTFHPHITLARGTEHATSLLGWRRTQREFTCPPVRVDAFDLCASTLRPTGAVHTLKERFALAN